MGRCRERKLQWARLWETDETKGECELMQVQCRPEELEAAVIIMERRIERDFCMFVDRKCEYQTFVGWIGKIG